MLALLGGTPVVGSELHLSYPPVGLRELALMQEALNSQTLWGPWAPLAQRLEKQWAERVGVPYCAVLNSGTAALHCALAGCGLGPPDEVIVPAYSFIATAAAVLMTGAIPIFADIQPRTGNLDPRLVEASITSNTRAIVVVHLHGLPADMDELLTIARHHKLYLIEDCAQAHGASYKGRQVGSIGHAGAFSLNATKVLAGPEGGLLTSNYEHIFNLANRVSVFGTEWRKGERLIRDADCLGYNYRAHELTAAFTLARLEAFDDEKKVRIENAQRLIKGLQGLSGISAPEPLDDRTHIFQMLRLRLDPKSLGLDMPAKTFRAHVLAALNSEGTRWWEWETRPLPAYSLFQNLNKGGRGYPWSLSSMRSNMRYAAEDYPVSVATADDSIFTYAHYPPNNANLMVLYAEAFRKVWEALDQALAVPLEESANKSQTPF